MFITAIFITQPIVITDVDEFEVQKNIFLINFSIELNIVSNELYCKLKISFSIYF